LDDLSLTPCNPFRLNYSSAKFGICTDVVGLNGTLVEAKILTWVQMPNLELIEKKLITVRLSFAFVSILFCKGPNLFAVTLSL